MSKNITTPSFLINNPDRKDHGSIKAPSLRHPSVDQQSFRMAIQGLLREVELLSDKAHTLEHNVVKVFDVCFVA